MHHVKSKLWHTLTIPTLCVTSQLGKNQVPYSPVKAESQQMKRTKQSQQTHPANQSQQMNGMNQRQQTHPANQMPPRPTSTFKWSTVAEGH
uniref:Secreted protein n=1 Tax=Anguilla anguilla TaxID=7936 RepID=A0A0E9XNY4_ANGAN